MSKCLLFKVLLFSCLLLPGAPTSELLAQAPPKAIVMAWDGAVPSFINNMLSDGKLPNLAKLIAGGVFADEVLPVFPSKTAPGFASLWTGANPRSTGISGNRQPRVPAHEHTILESQFAFLNATLRAEPIWFAALRSGRKTVLANVPLGRELSDGAVKFLGYDGYGGRDGVIDGRRAGLQPAHSWESLPSSDLPPLESRFTIGASEFYGLIIDDPADPQAGYDTLVISGSRDPWEAKTELKPGAANAEKPHWSEPIEIKTSGGESAKVYLRLFDLDPDGADFLLYHTRPARGMVFPSELAADHTRTAGPFIGNGASLLYQEGALGQTLVSGGNGIAELRYLETVRMAQRQLKKSAIWAMHAVPWDIFFLYTPFPDEAEHRWRGYIDSATNDDGKIASAAQGYLEDIYKSSDEFLGAVLANRPVNSLVALVSDHGMEGVSKLVAVNRVLEREGLLVLNDKGQPDLSRTKAFYPPSNNGYLLINSTDRKNGIVTREERPIVVKKLRRALLAIRDGDKAVVSTLYDAQNEGELMGIGGEAGGDIYLDLLPGYDFDARTGVGEIITSRAPYGTHGFNPARSSMRTLMVLNGPGVAVNRRLENVRLIDFAPTLAKLLDLPPPKNAAGRVLEEALADPRQTGVQ